MIATACTAPTTLLDVLFVAVVLVGPILAIGLVMWLVDR